MAVECPSEVRECPHLEASAQLAVKKVFAILGVDIDDPEKVEEFRMDLRFGRTMRKASDKGLMALVVMIAIAMGAALWAGMVAKITQGHS